RSTASRSSRSIVSFGKSRWMSSSHETVVSTDGSSPAERRISRRSRSVSRWYSQSSAASLAAPSAVSAAPPLHPLPASPRTSRHRSSVGSTSARVVLTEESLAGEEVVDARLDGSGTREHGRVDGESQQRAGRACQPAPVEQMARDELAL